MTFTKEELLKMSESELVLAASSVGITLVENGFSAADAVEEILNAQTPEVKPPAKKSAPKKAAKTADKVEPDRIRLIVHNQEGVESSKFVKVQHNGIMYAIPRETEVTVPQGVVSILNDAIMTRMTYEDGKMIETSARRFPFTVLGPA